MWNRYSDNFAQPGRQPTHLIMYVLLLQVETDETLAVRQHIASSI